MKKTVIQKMISDLKKLDSNKIELTNKGIMIILENSLLDERTQIIDAFNEGMVMEIMDKKIFEYPASRYYERTYKKLK